MRKRIPEGFGGADSGSEDADLQEGDVIGFGLIREGVSSDGEGRRWNQVRHRALHYAYTTGIGKQHVWEPAETAAAAATAAGAEGAHTLRAEAEKRSF